MFSDFWHDFGEKGDYLNSTNNSFSGNHFFSKLVRLGTGTSVNVDLLMLALGLLDVGLGYVMQYLPTAMPFSGFERASD